MRIFGLFLALSLVSLSLSAQPATPRKAPEFTIIEPSGKQLLLSSFRGKVVVLAFVFTTCPHCQAECGVLTKLQSELGDKGFQPLAVAFNPNAGLLVNDFIQNFHIGFPVGSAPRETVTSYLQLSDNDRWVVPQIAVIDRKGFIVAQSAPTGTEDLQTEDKLRKLITDLLSGGKKLGKS
ncbi:MAG: TlpA disulfide reductase family protein [Bryobacteraceae bacterium]|jgi:peroxiredoxin